MSLIHSVVVGGTRGIGRAIVRTFELDQHLVSVLGRRPAADAHLAKGTRHWAIDLLENDQLACALEDIVQQQGKVNNLVFCQRFRGEGQQWEGEIQVSLTATKNAIDLLAGEFAESGGKSIVVLGSHVSSLVAASQPVSYHVAKAAAAQLVRYYAVALAAKGVRVNVVTPGLVLKDEAREFYCQNQTRQNLLNSITPLGRMGSPQDIADAVLFLCSDRASFITGQNLVVDGGLSLEFPESLAVRLSS